jgi:hypothetical protein
MLELNISNVSNLDNLEKFLKLSGISKNEICITGSGVFTLYGVIKNSDIDFIGTNSARKKLEIYAKKHNLYLKNESWGNFRFGNVELKGDLNPSMPNRYTILKKNLTDDELIFNEKYHVVINGFKFLLPELVFSLKILLRRDKDMIHLTQIENSGLYESINWDWSKVILKSPWERKSQLKKTLINFSFQCMNLVYERNFPLLLSKSNKFILKVSNHLKDKYFNSYKNKNKLFLDIKNKNKNNFIFIQNLLSNQYDSRGNFIKYDLINKINKSNFQNFKFKNLILNRNGKINSFSIKNTDNNCHSAFKFSWSLIPFIKSYPISFYEKNFSKEYSLELQTLKNNLLINTGTSFKSVIWIPTNKNLSLIKNEIKKIYNIIGINKISLDNHLLRDFIEEIYELDTRSEKWLRDLKCFYLMKSNSFNNEIYLLDIEVPNPKFMYSQNQVIEKNLYQLKMDLRKKINFFSEDYIYTLDIHFADNFENNLHINKIINKYSQAK